MIKEITGTTRLTGLLGSPVAHSVSPQMHNAAFQLLGLDYVYLAFDVPVSRLSSAVSGLKELNVRGFNLTMPHKTAVMEYMDELTQASVLAGAVNTVTCENGKLIGHTTDGTGYMDSLRDAGFFIEGKTMTLCGAGGAATAICVQAAIDGVKKINMFKRKNATWNQTENFCKKVSASTGCMVSLYDINDKKILSEKIAESAILTNATNVGMAPEVNASVVTKDILFPELIVSDIIYNPRETRLLHDAKETGCPSLNGMNMLLFQGAASFECWTGQKMPIPQIKEKYFSN